MKLPVLFAFACALALCGCGVKSDLVRPNAPPQTAEKSPSKPPSQKNEKDPSKPPSQLGK